MFHTPHGMQPGFTRWGIGLMVVAALAASSIAFVVVDGRSLIFSSLIQRVVAPVPAVATTNYSAQPAGLTNYQGLFTTQLRPNYSAQPAGLTNYQGLFTTQLRQNYSPVPQGLTDHQAPLAAATVPSTSSALPSGLTDYQGLFTQLRPNYSQELSKDEILTMPWLTRSRLSEDEILTMPWLMRDHVRQVATLSEDEILTMPLQIQDHVRNQTTAAAPTSSCSWSPPIPATNSVYNSADCSVRITLP